MKTRAEGLVVFNIGSAKRVEGLAVVEGPNTELDQVEVMSMIGTVAI